MTAQLVSAEVLALYRTTVSFSGVIDWQFGALFDENNINTYPNPCDATNLWKGLNCTCSVLQCRITHLNLQNAQLYGPVSDILSLLLMGLPQLVELKLGNNYMFGSLPPISLANISSWSLKSLSLVYNRITGPLPSIWLCNNKLQSLNLRGNRLEGSVFTNISSHLNCNDSSLSIPVMQHLDLSSNLLSGDLSILFDHSLPYLLLRQNMEQLILSDNCLEAKSVLSMLDTMFCLSSYQFPVLQSMVFNRLYNEDRCISAGISQWGNSAQWWNTDVSSIFRSEPLNAPFPTCILYNVSSLTTLELVGNGLYGTVASQAGSLRNVSSALQVLDVSRNYLYGSVPMSIQTHRPNNSIRAWKTLRLDHNHFMGTLSQRFGMNVSSEVKMQYNELSGNLPVPTVESRVSSISLLAGNLFTCAPTLAVGWSQGASSATHMVISGSGISYILEPDQLPVYDPISDSYSCLFALPLILDDRVTNAQSPSQPSSEYSSLLLIAVMTASILCFWLLGLLRYGIFLLLNRKSIVADASQIHTTKPVAVDAATPTVLAATASNGAEVTDYHAHECGSPVVPQWGSTEWSKTIILSAYRELYSDLTRWTVNWVVFLSILWSFMWFPIVLITGAVVQRVQQTFLLQLCVSQWTGLSGAVILASVWSILVVAYYALPYVYSQYHYLQVVSIRSKSVLELVQSWIRQTWQTASLWIPLMLLSFAMHICFVFVGSSASFTSTIRFTDGMQLMTQAAVAVLVYLGNQLFIPLLVTLRISHPRLPFLQQQQDVVDSNETWNIFLENRRQLTLQLVLFQTIVAPICAVLVAHPQCFLYFLWPDQIVDRNGTEEDTYVYQFTCSDGFIQSYTIVFLFLLLLDLLVLPIVRGLGALLLWSVRLCMRCHKSKQHKRVQSEDGMDAVPDVLPWNAPSWIDKQLLEADIFCIRQQLNWYLLLTWGVVCPPLGLLMLTSMIGDLHAFLRWKLTDVCDMFPSSTRVQVPTPPSISHASLAADEKSDYQQDDDDDDDEEAPVVKETQRIIRAMLPPATAAQHDTSHNIHDHQSIDSDSNNESGKAVVKRLQKLAVRSTEVSDESRVYAESLHDRRPSARAQNFRNINTQGPQQYRDHQRVLQHIGEDGNDKEEASRVRSFQEDENHDDSGNEQDHIPKAVISKRAKGGELLTISSDVSSVKRKPVLGKTGLVSKGKFGSNAQILPAASSPTPSKATGVADGNMQQEASPSCSPNKKPAWNQNLASQNRNSNRNAPTSTATASPQAPKQKAGRVYPENNPEPSTKGEIGGEQLEDIDSGEESVAVSTLFPRHPSNPRSDHVATSSPAATATKITTTTTTTAAAATITATTTTNLHSEAKPSLDKIKERAEQRRKLYLREQAYQQMLREDAEEEILKMNQQQQQQQQTIVPKLPEFTNDVAASTATSGIQTSDENASRERLAWQRMYTTSIDGLTRSEQDRLHQLIAVVETRRRCTCHLWQGSYGTGWMTILAVTTFMAVFLLDIVARTGAFRDTLPASGDPSLLDSSLFVHRLSGKLRHDGSLFLLQLGIDKSLVLPREFVRWWRGWEVHWQSLCVRVVLPRMFEHRGGAVADVRAVAMFALWSVAAFVGMLWILAALLVLVGQMRGRWCSRSRQQRRNAEATLTNAEPPLEAQRQREVDEESAVTMHRSQHLQYDLRDLMEEVVADQIDGTACKNQKSGEEFPLWRLRLLIELTQLHNNNNH